MNKIFPLLFALTAAGAYASIQTNAVSESPKKSAAMSQSKIRAAIHKASLKMTGGKIRKPGSAAGVFVILNAQKRIDERLISPVLDTLDASLHIQGAIKSCNHIPLGQILSEVKNANGCAGVAIVDANDAPALLTAPEEGWAQINIAALAGDGVADEKLASRVRKETLRAFGFVCGAAYSNPGDNVMRSVRTPEGLDSLPKEEFGAYLIQSLPKTMETTGLIPWHQTTYLKACEEGWAPAPTNEYQKAIWDKVHATPKTPMKIEFDPKKGR